MLKRQWGKQRLKEAKCLYVRKFSVIQNKKNERDYFNQPFNCKPSKSNKNTTNGKYSLQVVILIRL